MTKILIILTTLFSQACLHSSAMVTTGQYAGRYSASSHECVVAQVEALSQSSSYEDVSNIEVDDTSGAWRAVALITAVGGGSLTGLAAADDACDTCSSGHSASASDIAIGVGVVTGIAVLITGLYAEFGPTCTVTLDTVYRSDLDRPGDVR